VPSYLPLEAKSEIADRVIQFIWDRTNKGLAANKKPWAGNAKHYSPEYGKKGTVNLEETSAMLSAMKFFRGKSKGENLTIGYTKGSKQERKAYIEEVADGEADD